MRFLENIISLIAPHECLACRSEGHLLCAACAVTLPPAAGEQKLQGIYHLWPGVIYTGIAKSTIHMLKFERAAGAANDIANSIAANLPLHSDWVVTHVPTASTRVRQRGYDQSHLIARSVAAQIAAPYAPLLARITGVRQVGATRMQRKQQMLSAFRALRESKVHQKHILLIDDVLTTGSTLEAAAAVLYAAGAYRVSAAVFASVPRGAFKKSSLLV